MNWRDKLIDLRRKIAEKKRILVAYSGGVDSSLLAWIASDILKENALCVIMDTETLPRSELLHAEELARSLGLNYVVKKFSILSRDDFAENSPNRCYFCKKASFEELLSLAKEMEIDCIADGVNLSDYDDFRPGIAACQEMGIWHPFVDSGISKEDIREIARNMQLSFWDRPSSACLASRIPYGEEVRVENLLMVELAEDFLKGLGFVQVRVRAHGKLARIELQEEDMQKALSLKDEIAKYFKSIGFLYTTMDLQAFRSGSMNEMLTRDEMAQRFPVSRQKH
jgi:uncharacterized protein